MTDSLKVGLAQFDSRVDDVAGNLAKVRASSTPVWLMGDLALTGGGR